VCLSPEPSTSRSSGRVLRDESSQNWYGFSVCGDDKSNASVSYNGFRCYDENRIPRALMDVDGFAYFDENFTPRALLGVVELVTPFTGAETPYPAAVVLPDDEGGVIFREP
jgi:hypothetical protein